METSFSLPQCTCLTARESFQFVNPDTGRKVTIKAGTVLWVTSTRVYQDIHGHLVATRLNAPMGTGWAFDFPTVDKLFSISGGN